MFSKLKTYFKSLTKKQLIFRLCLLIIPLLMFTGLIIYILAIPGDKGLISWVEWVRTYVIYVAIFGAALYALVGVDFLIASVKKAEIKRIPSIFLLVFLTLGLLISLGGFGFLGTIKLRRSGDKGPQLLVLDGVGTNGVPNMAVSFFTEDRTMNTLDWGKTSYLEFAEKNENRASKNHAFLLDTLEPGTKYYYRINEGKIYSFITPADTPNYARFAVSSDLHFGADNANRTASEGILKSINAHDYDILFNLGDMVEYGLFDSQYGEAMNYLSPYVTSIPYRPAIGNHDTMFGGKALWRGYFSPDLVDDAPTDYFHVEVNGIHVFVLDLEWGTETYTRAQQKWFEAELAETTEDDWILVMNHAMYYSSGYFVDGEPWWDNQEMIAEFEDLFIEHDVDLVFSGHNHHMEYLNNSGIIYNIIGTFGGHPDPDYTTKPVHGQGTGSIWYLAGQPGYLDVEIHGVSATLTFRAPEYDVVHSYIVTE